MNIDELIRKRKSVRAFTEREVPRADVESVIEAGRLAPYAGLAQGPVTDFRYFFVMKRDSEVCRQLMELVKSARMQDLKEAQELHLEKAYPSYVKVVQNMSGKEPVDLLAAPLLIVVAERAGMPPREHVALGYVLSQMWLKATDMGLGMKLCSGVGDIRDTEALKELLGLPKKESYAFDACSLGYAVESPYREGERSQPVKNVTYFG